MTQGRELHDLAPIYKTALSTITLPFTPAILDSLFFLIWHAFNVLVLSDLSNTDFRSLSKLLFLPQEDVQI